MNLFSKKTVMFKISGLFVYKMKIPRKWQIPLSHESSLLWNHLMIEKALFENKGFMFKYVVFS